MSDLVSSIASAEDMEQETPTDAKRKGTARLAWAGRGENVRERRRDGRKAVEGRREGRSVMESRREGRKVIEGRRIKQVEGNHENENSRENMIGQVYKEAVEGRGADTEAESDDDADALNAENEVEGKAWRIERSDATRNKAGNLVETDRE
ncbi:hypothetical protein K402DRAFT_402387 [Aulographum hederae CBS 113979]|uniref:Uncharacterized protein n=1 Tax=Aulographum hederae CBS 113979 TaxID=1176131 RepID=A0A6G1H836_9PEZI|nr:hypothetical protein K402DRAFT_402387 [Aulographum hederae CBS 113979]